MKKTNIIITGGLGNIGSSFVKKLVNNKKYFLYINSLDYSYYKIKKHSIFPLHISKIENLINSKNEIFKTFEQN